MNPIPSITRRSLLALAVLSLTSCAGMGLGETLGGLGGLGFPGVGSEIRGQIRSVDGRSRAIQLQSSTGRTMVLDYDSRTQVVFQNRRYSPSNLERGDYVSARIRQQDRRRPYADRIIVERSARDARDARGGYGDYGDYGDDDRYDTRGVRQRFDGRVASVDTRRGYFRLRQSRGPAYTVAMPYQPRNSDLNRFRRLRSGDRVRFEGVFLSRGRVELYRFR